MLPQSTDTRYLVGHARDCMLSRDTLARHLGDLVGEPVTFGARVRAGRAERPRMRRVLDRHGRTIAFLKLAGSASSRADLAAEARTLRQVAARTGEHLVVPTVLHEATWQDLALLVIEAQPRRRHGSTPPLLAMEELAAAFAQAPSRLDHLPWFDSQRRLAARQPDATVRDALQRGLDEVARRSGTHAWQVGAWHGSWTSSNMSQVRGRTHLWNWELFENGVPAGLDYHHHVVAAHTARRGVSTRTVLAGVERAVAESPRGDRPESLLAAVHLLAVALRHLGSGQGASGRNAELGACALEAVSIRLRLRDGEPAPDVRPRPAWTARRVRTNS